jgi:ribose 5-phosphate isomerase A
LIPTWWVDTLLLLAWRSAAHPPRSDLSPQNLVKGGGGALLREKMVEVCAKQFVVIVDQSKLCDGLGPHFPVPVEIVSFCHEHTMRLIAALPSIAAAGCKPVLRMGSSANNKVDGDEVAITDNGNYIVDLHFEAPLADPAAAANEILGVVGVVEQCVKHCCR